MGNIYLQRLLWLGMAACTLWWFADYSQKWLWPAPAQDYGMFYAASRRVLDGQALQVYDVAKHVAYQSQLYGIKVGHGLGFFYPPPGLMFVAPLALVNFGISFVGFLLTGLAVFTTLLRRITGDWIVALAMATSIGAPTQNIYFNHTGFITASLLGGGLLALKHSKVAAGILLGLLCLKPHLGAVAMLMLLVWREWRAFGVACLTGLTLAVISTAVFGWDVWWAYLQATRDFSEIVMQKFGVRPSSMLQTIAFALGPRIGWTPAIFVHISVALGALYLACRMQQRETRIVAVICATALVSPYMFIYDGVMMLVAAALLMRVEPRMTLLVVAAMTITGSWYVLKGNPAPITAMALLAMAWFLERRATRKMQLVAS